MALLAQARRIIERQWSARFVLAFVLAIPGMIAIERGNHVAGVVAIVLAIALTAAIVFAAPERSLVRLERRARRNLPAEDGEVVLVGTVVSAVESLVAPLSKTSCVAYWERTLQEVDGGWSTTAEATRTVDFVMQCGESLVAVEGAHATVLFDAARATWSREEERRWRYEESAAAIGAPVLVAGKLVRGSGEGPFRSSARITAGKRSVVVGLVQRPGNRDAA